MNYVIGPGWGFQHARLVKAEDLGFAAEDFENLEPFRLPIENGGITFKFSEIVWEFSATATFEGTVYLPLRAYIKPAPPRCLRPTAWTKE